MSIERLINEALLKEQEVKKLRVRSGKFNPSSLGRCYRYQVWNRQNEPQTNPPDVNALRRFKCGVLFHDFVQRLLPDTYESEVLVDIDDIYGRADLVGTRDVVEIKSIHSRAFWYMQKKEYKIESQKRTNILQVMCYAWLLDKPIGRLIFVSKDDLCTAEYAFETAKWKKRVMGELSVLRKWWNSGKLPPAKQRAYGGKECSYCNFSSKCKEIEIKKIRGGVR